MHEAAGAETPREAELPRDINAPKIARDYLATWLGNDLDAMQLGTAKLLASELVSNALRHGKGRIELRAHVDGNRVLVEVIDEGSGFERVVEREQFGDIGGWGLNIVEAESSRWGIHEGTTHVWFELERPGPRVGVEQRPDPDAGTE
jgi:anti-sigma regulatory factor (Ser/Thr protein kinase)